MSSEPTIQIIRNGVEVKPFRCSCGEILAMTDGAALYCPGLITWSVKLCCPSCQQPKVWKPVKPAPLGCCR
jgi:hypothetical protein